MKQQALLGVAGIAVLMFPDLAHAQPAEGNIANGQFTDLLLPFLQLSKALLDALITLLGTTPTVKPNPPVEEIHRLTLVVSYVVAGFVIVETGLHYIGIGIFSHEKAREMLPDLIMGLLFATISLPLLQFGVELSDAFVTAFRPPESALEVEQVVGLTSGFALVALIDALLLLALVVLFILRDIYILFVAAISPLLAVAWALPTAKPYSEEFMAGWITAWLIAPLDTLALRFILELLSWEGATGIQAVTNWMLGVASLTLLLWIPYQLHGASREAVFRASSIARGIGSIRQDDDDERPDDDDWEEWREERDRRRDRDRWGRR